MLIIDPQTLLIIGNGFDLNIGVHSTYTDFFRYKKIIDDKNSIYNDKLIEMKSIIDQIEREDSGAQIFNLNDFSESKLDRLRKELHHKVLNENEYLSENFWVNYFRYMYKLEKYADNWSDVEETIKRVLTKENYFKVLNANYEQDSINKLINKLASNKLKNNEQYELLISIKLLNKVIKNKKVDIYDILLSHLKEFENYFKEFLFNEIENNIGLDKYYDLADELVLDLIEGGKDLKKNYSLINFNYTMFYDLEDNQKVNVHSNIKNGHPIFGIDSKILNEVGSKNVDFSMPKYFKFTKTFRIMDMADEKSIKNILSSDIRRIIFYGHSLSEADYSYFLAIFDYYNIYSSDVNLVFKYNAHGVHDNEEDEYKDALEEKEKLKIRVFRLINKYGSEISHGDNLLHKILLENRLIFKRTINFNHESN